jgi:hypothetical protein
MTREMAAVVCAVLFCAHRAGGQVVAVPPFTGDAVETFESYPIFSHPPAPLSTQVGVIHGQLEIYNGLHADGDRSAMSDVAYTIHEIVFAEPVHDFGAYWGSWPEGGYTGLGIALRDPDGEIIFWRIIDDGFPFALLWHGWHSETPIGSVTCYGYGWLIIDSLRITVHASSCQRADINADGVVDVSDFLFLLSDWGPCPGCPSDIDQDGIVGITDFLDLLAQWGPCP